MSDIAIQLAAAVWEGLSQVPGAILGSGRIFLVALYDEFGLLWTVLAALALVVCGVMGARRWLMSRIS